MKTNTDILKVGDRVRIHGLENDGDIYSTTVGTYIECPELDGMTGTIIEVNKDGYIVREDSGHEEDFIGACLTLIERPRRTFEEIVKELGEKYQKEGWTVNLYQGYILMLRLHSEITIFDNGGIDISELRATPAELAAISSACTEIAALRKEEQPKEHNAPACRCFTGKDEWNSKPISPALQPSPPAR